MVGGAPVNQQEIWEFVKKKQFFVAYRIDFSLVTTIFSHFEGPFDIFVDFASWHSLGREIESRPRVRECFPLNTPWSGYCHYAGLMMGGWGNLAGLRVNT